MSATAFANVSQPNRVVAAVRHAVARPLVAVEMENNHKLIALVSLALVAQGGLLYNAYMSWGSGMPEGIATLNVFFKESKNEID